MKDIEIQLPNSNPREATLTPLTAILAETRVTFYDSRSALKVFVSWKVEVYFPL